MVSGIIVMGVAGSGKTTVGRALAAALGWEFHDADAFHPEANIAKMQAGRPLTDEDRQPWLAALHALLERAARQERPIVLACSALTERYRRQLRDGLPDVVFVFLKAPPDLLAARLAGRAGHFFDPGLLHSQLAALEEPERAVAVDAALPPDRIVAAVRDRLGL